MILWHSLRVWKKNIRNRHVTDQGHVIDRDHVIEATEDEEVEVGTGNEEKIVVVEVEIDQTVGDMIVVDLVIAEDHGHVTEIAVVHIDTEFNLILSQSLERFTMEKLPQYKILDVLLLSRDSSKKSKVSVIYRN